MLFNSFQFIFIYLPIFLLIYIFCPKKHKTLCVFGFGLIFYGVGVVEHPIHFLFFIISIIFNFTYGLLIKSRQSKTVLTIGIVINFLVLFLYKYLNFLFEILQPIIARIFGIDEPIVLDIVAPLGISFFTFQNVSYLVYVFKTSKAEKLFINYGAYISMFPQLISGPLVRYESIKTQLTNYKISLQNIIVGLEYFVFGLGFKVLLANRVGGLWKDVNTIGYDSISTPLAWLGIIAFSLQLYFDFWGYSLMAQGLGKMMGIELPKNFDTPYMSLTMTDFWRRWHISLGMWFREFVYIPLGGNRVSKGRNILNIFVVWLLTALWHGASFNFVLWGLFLFILILSEKLWLGKFWNKHKALGHIYMFFAIIISWLLFAINDIGDIGVYLKCLFGIQGENVFIGDFVKRLKNYGLFVLSGLLLSTKLPIIIYNKLNNKLILKTIILLIIFVSSLYFIKMGQSDPFMYFSF